MNGGIEISIPQRETKKRTSEKEYKRKRMEAINTTGGHAYKGSTLEIDREKQDKDLKIPAFLFSTLT